MVAGTSFDERFSTGSNAFRGAVIPLIGASLVLIAFLLWARWDFVFKDPERLPMRPVRWVPVVLYTLAIVVQFAADWSQASDRLLAVAAAGILVGFAEETLFRGITLRSLRTNARPEAWAMLITTVWFGLFHLLSVFGGWTSSARSRSASWLPLPALRITSSVARGGCSSWRCSRMASGTCPCSFPLRVAR